MTIVFDPPIEYSGDVVDRMDAFPVLHTYLYRADRSVICTAGHVLHSRMQRIDLSQKAFADATGEETHFTMVDEGPHIDGESLYLMGGDDPEPPQTLRRITRIEVVGKLTAHVAEMPLKHGQYEGTNFSTGTAEMGDLAFHWVITEGAEGTHIGARVLPLSGSPTSGQFYEGGQESSSPNLRPHIRRRL